MPRLFNEARLENGPLAVFEADFGVPANDISIVDAFGSVAPAPPAPAVLFAGMTGPA